ncbi:MAG: arylesterase [Syntrophobacteraceae bacterium]
MPTSLALFRSSALILFTLVLMLLFSRTDGMAKDLTEGQPNAETEGAIVAFGNSLTEGYTLPEADAYPAQLERKLRAEGYRYRVVNAGINGETSSGALSRVKWILRMKPDIVILETGANDGFRGIKPEVIEQNITETIRLLKEANVVVVLAGMQMLSNLGNDYTTAFREIYPRVARNQGVILIPFFLQGVAAEPSLNLPDGIHPTAKGHSIVAQNVFPHVIEAIKQVRR